MKESLRMRWSPAQVRFLSNGLRGNLWSSIACGDFLEREILEKMVHVNSDGSLTLLKSNDFRVERFEGHRFPVVFQEVWGMFLVSNCKYLKTLEGFPRRMNMLPFSDYVRHCPNVPSLEMEIFSSNETYEAWASSGMTFREFGVARRGTLKGRKFGI